MDSDAIVRRFRVERRILASLEHPNIARLVDGGLLDDGRPWFAMEYIDGQPLTEWCDQRRIGLQARLELFEQVCRAVQYAHGRLIVHRDLKPANILVTADATVKLLDFGIAKLLEDNEVESLTLIGQRVMTPEYAAPEQVRGEPVSTATDVHALGVVLYELSTGEQPFLRMADSQEKLAGVICDTDPTAPSAIAARPNGTGLSKRLNMRPALLRRRLRGDLDTIVLKAMAKDPARRYGSAEELAEDIRRHLDGLPVRARRDSPAYRARRFLVRHRIGVAATALVMLSLAGGVVGVLWQSAQTASEARRDEEVKGFLIELFEWSDPDRSAGEDLTARMLLAQGSRRIEHEFADQPALKIEMLSVLAKPNSALGDYDRALELYREALTLASQREKPNHPLLLELRIDIARMLH